jgi:nucleoside-diphosphate-sugar epimerase
VIHLAAALRDEPGPALVAANVTGTISLLNALGASRSRARIVLGSSGSVYGPIDSVPIDERARCAPDEPYARSKLAAEYAALVLAQAAGLPLAIARIFNIAGPGQDERHVCGRFAAQAVAIAQGLREPSIEIGDLSATRDFVDVRDVASGLALIARDSTPAGVYNVASGCESAIQEVLDLTLANAGIVGRVEVVRRYAGARGVARQRADITRLRSLGYFPAFTLASSVTDLVAYYAETVAKSVAVTSASNASDTAEPASHG